MWNFQVRLRRICSHLQVIGSGLGFSERVGSWDPRILQSGVALRKSIGLRLKQHCYYQERRRRRRLSSSFERCSPQQGSAHSDIRFASFPVVWSKVLRRESSATVQALGHFEPTSPIFLNPTKPEKCFLNLGYDNPYNSQLKIMMIFSGVLRPA